MTVQYGGKTKEAKLKDLYDDIAANEKEWLTFLNHPYNIEFVFIKTAERVSSRLWGKYREAMMKERGTEIPHDIEEVDDKLITEHMRVRGMEGMKGEKRDDTKLNKDLVDFFELDGNFVSYQEKKRIKDFVGGLSDVYLRWWNGRFDHQSKEGNAKVC